MKKVLLVAASPRKGGNSETAIDILATDLRSCEVTVFKMREHNCNLCMACDACQNKDTQRCVQNDDIAALIPTIENCDGIVLATPIWNQQICSQAKLFIERWYPFFNFSKRLMSNTSKYGKKGALICSFWGSNPEITRNYADWTVSGFSQIGVEETKSLIFPQIPKCGDIAKNEDYIKQLHNLAAWLTE